MQVGTSETSIVARVCIHICKKTFNYPSDLVSVEEGCLLVCCIVPITVDFPFLSPFCSWVDVIHLLYLLSLLFFFLFVRSEFLRNIEECIWTTMGEIQETFDIRKF